MKMTANDLFAVSIVDHVIPEPEAGAHEDWDGAAAILGDHLAVRLAQSEAMTTTERLERRYQKFRALGESEG